MSTFNGFLREIPYIRVDRFNTYDEDTKIFFLTHCHADHTVGICDEFFLDLKRRNLFLYASPISVRILKNDYPDFTCRLKEVIVGEYSLIQTEYRGEIIYLTYKAIPAGHCPGSVMFLFDTERFQVLYTGDFRIDKHEQFMNKYFKDVTSIETIYLDTTFCKKEFPHFPTRKESLSGLCDLITSWLNRDKTNLIKLTFPATYGSEYLFKGIYESTGFKIHVNERRYNLHKFIPDLDEMIDVDDYKLKLRIHACDNFFCRLANSSPTKICEIKITAMIWTHYQPGDSVVSYEGGNFYRVCASYHPSYNEINDFINYLKPKRIIACVFPQKPDEQIKMLGLLKEMTRNYSKREIDEKFVIDVGKMLKSEDNRKKKLLRNDDLLSSPPRRFKKLQPSDVDLNR
ncbi:dna cross-link repair protein pso2/snm1-related [Holotrichia oblita]|uniref:Dna cross-link repair protein pso2/snm1-related n=1 Tax=Holotrichia oblita TaxID=644536 RepID=A0ACB9T0Y3_HOLOL|nr:dna cross-link repair protein pso2/snm1-related [Holotrichia oblita]